MCDSCHLSCRQYLISFHRTLQSLRVPVIVASEAYKFCEKVQLDSVVYNELGSASEIVSHAQGEIGAGRVHVNMNCITSSSCDYNEDF